MLFGGLNPNRIYLLEGDPGTGKTTLALQFMLEGARAGEKCLYVTLSETAEELRAVARSHGWSLDGVTIFELTPPEANFAADQYYTLLHPSEVELSETIKLILDRIEELQPDRVAFDSLAEIRLLAQDPLRYRRQVLALKQFFAGRRSTALLLDDLTSRSHELQVHSITHGVIVLERFVREYGAERRRIQITKMRGANFRGGWHDVVIATGGLSVFPRISVEDTIDAFAGTNGQQRRARSGRAARRRSASRHQHAAGRTRGRRQIVALHAICLGCAGTRRIRRHLHFRRKPQHADRAIHRFGHAPPAASG